MSEESDRVIVVKKQANESYNEEEFVERRTDGLPNRIRQNIILHQETIYGIVRKLGIMLSHIGLSEICNGCNDELTVILSCRL